jgi:hypothetical protein
VGRHLRIATLSWEESRPAAGTTGLVREKSHLDDMRAAIRGDFDRLAKRRGSQELMREVSDSEPEAEPAAQPEPESAVDPRPEDVSTAKPPRRSWIARILGL